MKIAVAGSNGFVGSAICRELKKDPTVELTEITRNSWEDCILHYNLPNILFDVVINAATPSKRFKAQQNPGWDFEETVNKTSEFLNILKYTEFIQISSISARIALNTVYGRHKRAAENLIDPYRHAVVRLGPMYGQGLNKGVLIDMINDRKVYVAAMSSYAFVDVEQVAAKICDCFVYGSSYGINELLGTKEYRLDHLANYLRSKSAFNGPPDDQVYDPDFYNTILMPNNISGHNVVDWMLANKDKLKETP